LKGTRTALMRSDTYKNYVFLHIGIVFYSFIALIAKQASGYNFFSFEFLMFISIEFFMLAVYAVLWQKILKKIDASTAYSNRAAAIIWTLLWGAIFFQEELSINNLIGAAVIIFGIVMVVKEDE